MGERVEFPSNGHTCQGYVATPKSGGKGPAVVVIQEWWGLVRHIEDICDRFAADGFLAIAPDLFHGKTTKSPDEAGKLLMEMEVERAGNEITGAGEYLLSRPECSSSTYGIVGFCMGGALAQYGGTIGTHVGAVASFYGGFKKVPLDWTKLSAPLLLIYGENDMAVPMHTGTELAIKLKEMGKDVKLVTYPSADHAFFNDTRPEVYNEEASADARRRTIELFRMHVR